MPQTLLTTRDRPRYILVAGCIYNKVVFKLFIQQLGGLEHTESPNSNKIAYLLERLAVVKAFVLVVDFSDLKLKLFQQLFRVIRYVILFILSNCAK